MVHIILKLITFITADSLILVLLQLALEVGNVIWKKVQYMNSDNNN